MIKFLAIGMGVLVLAVGAEGWFLLKAHESIGSLKQANEQLTKAINDKSKATQSRANAERDTRQLDPAGRRDKLR